MKIRLPALLIISIFIFVNSCKKDEGPTVEESKKTLQNLSATVETDLDQIFESEGMDAMIAMFDFFAMDDPLGLNFDLGIKKSTLPEKSFQPADLAKRFAGFLGINDDDFDFDTLTGVLYMESLHRKVVGRCRQST